MKNNTSWKAALQAPAGVSLEDVEVGGDGTAAAVVDIEFSC